MKKCCKCKEVKPPTEFYSNGEGKLHFRCKDCDRAKAREYRRANLTKVNLANRDWHRRNPWWKKQKRLKKYGLTQEQFDDINTAQGGVCAICKQPYKRGHVDHCHRTGRVRGLLCIPCNLGIGHLKESREIMERAMDYLAFN